jgi:hypothetical protein
MFPNLKKISDLNKALIINDKRNTNGNSFYKDYENEKKETLLKIINPDNSVKLIKKNLTRNRNVESRDVEVENVSTQLEEENYLRKLIKKNKMRNRSQNDLNFFDTYDQRNKKILNAIKEKYQRNKNHSIHKNFKIINQKYENLFKKRKINDISYKMRNISHKINEANKQLNTFINDANKIFNKDINTVFD